MKTKAIQHYMAADIISKLSDIPPFAKNGRTGVLAGPNWLINVDEMCPRRGRHSPILEKRFSQSDKNSVICYSSSARANRMQPQNISILFNTIIVLGKEQRVTLSRS
jgi:hypothetical protein